MMQQQFALLLVALGVSNLFNFVSAAYGAACLPFSSTTNLNREASVHCFDTYAFLQEGSLVASIRCAALENKLSRLETWFMRKVGNFFSKRKYSTADLARLSHNTALFLRDLALGRNIRIQFLNEHMDAAYLTIGSTGRYGDIEKTVNIPPTAIVYNQNSETGGVANFRVKHSQASNEESCGKVMVVDNPAFGVFSDIDDTIKITHVLDTTRMIRSSLMDEYQPVTGMPELYELIRNRFRAIDGDYDPDGEKQVPLFFYVSGSPWQLVHSLSDFFTRNYPPGEIMLRQFRLSLRAWMNMPSIRAYKLQKFELLHSRFPDLGWYLIGDSGQLDPEIFASIYHLHPLKVICIWIHKVTATDIVDVTEKNSDGRFSRAFKDIPSSKWNTFSDPTAMMNFSEGVCR